MLCHFLGHPIYIGELRLGYNVIKTEKVAVRNQQIYSTSVKNSTHTDLLRFCSSRLISLTMVSASMSFSLSSSMLPMSLTSLLSPSLNLYSSLADGSTRINTWSYQYITHQHCSILYKLKLFMPGVALPPVQARQLLSHLSFVCS